jgi:hypothetical protein
MKREIGKKVLRMKESAVLMNNSDGGEKSDAANRPSIKVVRHNKSRR